MAKPIRSPPLSKKRKSAKMNVARILFTIVVEESAPLTNTFNVDFNVGLKVRVVNMTTGVCQLI